MMKKVKKKDLPKYAGGTPLASPNSGALIKAGMNVPTLNKINTRAGVAPPTGSGGGSASSSGGGFGGFNAGAISAAGTWAGKELMGLAGIDDNSQAGVTLNASMKGAELGGSIMPGWGHLIGGVAGAALGAFKKGSVDPNTGEVQMGGIFGRSKTSLYSEANRIKNSIQARERTLDIQMEYMNDPNVEIQPDVLAAEGGIMRKPVDALVSKGELIYNPENKKLTKVPGSKGKPNKKDDVYVRLYEGDVVVSNSPTMLMSNGKTPALNLERMVTVDKKKKDNNLSEGTAKAREAIIKKVVNWQEANKTEPQEYPMYEGGTSNVSKNIKKYGYNKNMSEFAYWDKDKNDYKKEYIDWVNGLTQKDVNDIFSGKYGNMSTYKGINKDYIPTVEEARKLMTDKKYGDWHKMSQAVMQQQTAPKYEAMKNARSYLPIYGGLSDSRTVSQTPNGTFLTTERIKGVDKPILSKINIPNPYESKSDKSINWNKIGDNLYKAASVLTPLFDREKAEPVQYQVPIAKYRSTAVNVDPQLRAIDESYALARYNQANINPSTGAGMAYGLQAAANRAKQRSDVYNWQTNAQNELIGKNVDTYNRWSENYAGIMNNVYDKAAANRAAARNINRQNTATALKNWGSILRNDKQYAMDRVRMEALDPMLKYGYQNDAELRRLIQEQIG